MTPDPKAFPSGIVLDVSRLVSRIGGGALTGIDRVEAEWLAHLTGPDAPCPVLLLCRITGAQALLPATTGAAILRWAAGDLSDLPRHPGWRDRLARRNTPRHRAMAALRRTALRLLPRSGQGIARAIELLLGCDRARVAYLNLGHSNLSARLLDHLSGSRRVVMIHDTIPLDHPEFTRAGQSDRFAGRLRAALGGADLILAISDATAQRILHWQAQFRITHRPELLRIPIGTRLATPDPAAIPADLHLPRPFFIALGTIEPRKNHALLLDVWDRLAASLPADRLPHLLIIGRRGWENRAVFARLDTLGPQDAVLERADLSDGAVAALLDRCHGLLMPSLAEGFGLPLTEAAGRGVPVMATPLPSTFEMLGEYASYLPPDDADAWATQIIASAGQRPQRFPPLAIWSWPRHFARVAEALGAHDRAAADPGGPAGGDDQWR